MLPVPQKKADFHSERSPSTAHRWRLCVGSVEESRGLPDEVGEDAIQGTVFHDYAADCLETGIDPTHFIGSRMWVNDADDYREFTAEMAKKMIPGLDLLWALADEPGAKMHVEERVNLERWIGKDESGTADAFVIDTQNWRLTTFDWKWGIGVPVSPEWNDQAILYTLGVWDTFAEDPFRDAYEANPGPKTSWEEARDSIEVTIIIEQPRAPGGGGIWTTNLGSLFAEGKRIRRDADATTVPGAPRTPGEKQCKFCPAARHNTCEARAEYITDMIGVTLDDLEDDLAVGAELELADRRALTPEQRSQIVLHSKLITDWVKALHDEAMADAKKGLPTPGLKRVEGRRPARKWKDEKRAEIILSKDFDDEAWTKKLRSPTWVEDEVGTKVYESRYLSNVDTGDAKPILVPETDPRPEVPSDDDLLDDIFDEGKHDETEDLI